MIFALEILGMIAALALGIWLGLPGRYKQTPEDLKDSMDEGGGFRRHHQKRSLSPVAWALRKGSVETPRSRHARGFHLDSPDKE